MFLLLAAGSPAPLILLAALIAPPVPASFPPGTPTPNASVVVIGRLTGRFSKHHLVGSRTLHVTVGPERTPEVLYVGHAILAPMDEKPLRVEDLKPGWWVRAEGTVMPDPKRIEVTHLVVVATDDAGFGATRLSPAGGVDGMIVPKGMVRELFAGTSPLPADTRVVLVCEVTSRPPRSVLGPQPEVQVAVGEKGDEYRLIGLKSTELFAAGGQSMALSDLPDGAWVRVEGTMAGSGLGIRVTRLRVLAPNREAFLSSPYFLPKYDRGYLMPEDRAPSYYR